MNRMWLARVSIAVVVLLLGTGASLNTSTTNATQLEGFGPWEPLHASAGEMPAPVIAQQLIPTADIQVTFVDVPTEHRPAIELSAAIWESQLTSSAAIHVVVSWKPLPSDTLAQTRTAFRIKDETEDPNLPLAAIRYPAALAHAIRGHRVGSTPDMEIELSSVVTAWYSGLVGQPGNNEMNMVTVVIHEMAHGLGITSQLAYGQPVPAAFATVYDTFVTMRDGSKLYKGTGAALNEAFLGREVLFSGPATNVAAGGAPPRLHTASPPDSRATLSHLHEWYVDTDSNALMGPVIGRGWVLQSPGPILLAMLKDIGWTVSRLGQATRLRIVSPVPSFVDVDDSMAPVRVEVQDPVGAFVPSGPSIFLTIHAFVSPQPGAAWGCIGPASRSTSGGRVVFEECSFGGPGSVTLVVTAPGMMQGSTHHFRVADIHTGRAPAIARAP